MGLQVWLPLDGNLRNLGVNQVRIDSDIFPTIDEHGKIGSCYNFNSTSQQRFRIYDYSPNGQSEFSFACWAYLRADPWYIFLIRGDSAHRLRFNSGGFTFRDNNNSTLRTLTWGTNEPPLNEWVHLAATYNRGQMCLYLNGSLVATSDTYYNANSVLLSDMDEVRIGRQQASTSDDFLDGKLNDIRFYDHCLSAAEVHEIAQGLILHYKLDQANENLLLDKPQDYLATAYRVYELAMKENLVAGQTYTLQLWDVLVEHSGKTAANMNLCVYWGGGTVQLKKFSGTSDFTVLQDHYAYSPYLCAQITPTEANASGAGATNAWLNLYNSVSNASGTRNMKIGAWKL